MSENSESVELWSKVPVLEWAADQASDRTRGVKALKVARGMHGVGTMEYSTTVLLRDTHTWAWGADR